MLQRDMCLAITLNNYVHEPYTRPVCTVLWEGWGGDASPYSIVSCTLVQITFCEGGTFLPPLTTSAIDDSVASSSKFCLSSILRIYYNFSIVRANLFVIYSAFKHRVLFISNNNKSDQTIWRLAVPQQQKEDIVFQSVFDSRNTKLRKRQFKRWGQG